MICLAFNAKTVKELTIGSVKRALETRKTIAAGSGSVIRAN